MTGLTTIVVDPADPRNQTDVRRYISDTVIEDQLQQVLADRGVPPPVFAARLADATGGVWVYARYVLWEIRLHRRSPTDLASLPHELYGYYAATLAGYAREPDWDNHGLPLLAGLAAAGEPLPTSTLAAHTGIDDPAVVDRWCRVYRPFLTVTGDWAQRRYSVYHASLREFTRGSRANDASNIRSTGV